MFDLLLVALAQVVAGPPADVPAAAPAAAEETSAAKPAPKVKCRMEKVSGSHTRRQKVCDDKASRENGKLARRNLQNMQNGRGDEPLPSGGG
jgi:hypothetical protein